MIEGASTFRILMQSGISTEMIGAIILAASNLTMSEEHMVGAPIDDIYYMDKHDVEESFDFHCDHIAQKIIEGLGLPQAN